MTRWRPGVAAAAVALLLVGVGCSSEGGSRKAFCTQVAKVPPLSGVLASYDQAEPGELTRRLATTRTAYDDLRKAAPSAIEKETRAVVDLVDDVLDAVEEHATDPTKVQDAVRTAVAEHADAGPGATKLVAYASDRCGVELDPSVGGAPVTTTTGG